MPHLLSDIVSAFNAEGPRFKPKPDIGPFYILPSALLQLQHLLSAALTVATPRLLITLFFHMVMKYFAVLQCIPGLTFVKYTCACWVIVHTLYDTL